MIRLQVVAGRADPDVCVVAVMQPKYLSYCFSRRPKLCTKQQA